MNERIWELWNQATLDPTNQDSPDLIEKFAELIVRESSNLFEIEWGEEKLTGNEVSGFLKKHFGVEE
jgi:hypothetical protein